MKLTHDGAEVAATAGRLADSRARARSLHRVLQLVADGSMASTPDLLAACARSADRIALDMAVVERNLAVSGVAA